MKKKHFEDSAASRIVVNMLDILLLYASFLLTYIISQHSAQEKVALQDMQRLCNIAIICYIPVAMQFPPIAMQRVCSTDKIASNVFLTSATHFIFFLLAAFMFKIADTLSIYFLAAYVTFTFLLLAERIVLFKYLSKIRRKGANLVRVILVGNGEEMHKLYKDLKTTVYGLDIIGVFAQPEETELPEGMTPKGTPPMALNYLKEHANDIDIVYCSTTSLSKENAMALYTFCENNFIRFFIVPMFANLTRRYMATNQVGSSFVLSPRQEPLHSMGNRAIKRTLDLLVSSVFLATLFPIVYTIVAAIIKCQSPGPVLFRQKRTGLYGNEFYCLKFRSMHVNADADKVQATENDPRKFPFGDFMRRHNIDELPQFINVLMGSMSLVGPRPHMIAHTEEYRKIVNRYMVRHWVKPGITGWAQVQGLRGETRNLIQMRKRVHADIWYVTNWSFWLDVRIIARTLLQTLLNKEKNAY